MPKNNSTIIRLSLTAISTALVSVATMVFSVYVPQTRGFFNIGETMIYTSAILFGSTIGGFAGGVGSMLADIFLGYPHYALATLVIKGCEGGIVGFFSRKKPKFRSKFLWRVFTFCAGLIAGIILGIIGSRYYIGTVELYLGIPPPEFPNVILSIPSEFWFAVAALIVLLITLIGFIMEPKFGWQIFSMLIGGTTMVIGYFLYQYFILFPLFSLSPVIALAEIPVNIGQMVIGLIISLPIVKIVRLSLPQLNREE
jgi:uncharacterized membrane protein